MLQPTVRGMYCMRCGTRKVVRGTLEAARFYPLRSLLRALLAKPVFLQNEHTHACLECGLVWNEVDPQQLRGNLRTYGIAPHATGTMQAIRSTEVDLRI